MISRSISFVFLSQNYISNEISSYILIGSIVFLKSIEKVRFKERIEILDFVFLIIWALVSINQDSILYLYISILLYLTSRHLTGENRVLEFSTTVVLLILFSLTTLSSFQILISYLIVVWLLVFAFNLNINDQFSLKRFSPNLLHSFVISSLYEQFSKLNIIQSDYFTILIYSIVLVSIIAVFLDKRRFVMPVIFLMTIPLHLQWWVFAIFMTLINMYPFFKNQKLKRVFYHSFWLAWIFVVLAVKKIGALPVYDYIFVALLILLPVAVLSKESWND